MCEAQYVPFRGEVLIVSFQLFHHYNNHLLIAERIISRHSTNLKEEYKISTLIKDSKYKLMFVIKYENYN